MTCIIALEYDNKIYMGGDSAAVSGWDLQRVTHPKVFKMGEFLIGYTTSFRMGQLLQYDLSIPKNTEDDDLKYLVSSFIPAVRNCMKEGGFTKIENSQEEGGIFLVGYRHKIYTVWQDFQVLNTQEQFCAIGCGASYSLGALAEMNVTDPRKAILKALKIAGDFSAGVHEPYYVLTA